MVEQKIKKFIDALETTDFSSRNPFENIYKRQECRDNLEIYLNHVKQNGTGIMLVGEAPGYRGCKLTGIPFTDGIQLKNELNSFALGDVTKYVIREQIKENSATIIWEALRTTENHMVPLLWNSFPFHPYGEKGEQTNRNPESDEIAWGREQIEKLIEIFQIDRRNIYAVGRKAQLQLGYQSDDLYIRHPSYGGKNECQSKIIQIAHKTVDC